MRQAQASATQPSNSKARDVVVRLDEIEAMLDEAAEVPLPAHLVQEDVWATAYADLKDIAQRPDVPELVRAKADTMLRIAFADAGADDRFEERFDHVVAQLRASRMRVDAAIEAVGWRPSPFTAEVLHSLTFRYNLRVEDLVSIIMAIRSEKEAM